MRLPLIALLKQLPERCGSAGKAAIEPDTAKTPEVREFLLICFAGLLLAAAINWGLYSRVLNLEYPWNTFLFNPEVRFSDFFQHLNAAENLNPYWEENAKEAVYQPFAYLIYFIFGKFGSWSYAVFLAISFAVWLSLFLTALPYKQIWRRSIVGVVLLLVQYPVWMAVDRGNSDLLLAGVAGWALWLLWRQRFWWGATLIGLLAAFKISPAVFALCWLAKRKYWPVLFAGGLAVVVELASFKMLLTSFSMSIYGLKEHLDIYTYLYIYGNSGFMYNCTLYGWVKLLLMYWLPLRFVVFFYKIPAVAVGGYLAWKAFMAKSLYKIAGLTAIIFILCPHFSMDYRLLYLVGPLLLLWQSGAAATEKRALSRLYALIFIPKHYLFLPGTWISVSSFINPVLLLILAWWLIRNWSPPLQAPHLSKIKPSSPTML